MTKVAVVTGASKGIGLAIVKDLLNKDFSVWGVSKSKPEESLGERFHWIGFDLRKYREIEELVEQLPKLGN